MGLLEGHRAIVTGGGSGMGAATARRMAEEGAQVAVVDIDGEAARDVAAEFGGHFHQVDVSVWAEVRDAFAAAAEAMGGLSILHNNAGVSLSTGLEDIEPELWQRIIDVNLTGVFYGLKAAIPVMLAGGDGRIVNTASISGVRASDGEAPYAAAKAGVIALTATTALEHGPVIRCNAVSPGTIHTPMTHQFLTLIPGMYEHQVKKIPLGRVGEPDDVADVVVLLCSDLTRYINGQNIVVDGGMLLHGAGSDGSLFWVRELLAEQEARRAGDEG
ncbi:MAG TPA: SDR family NAD(P)-dependent oxidoreductase [Acidimicrobiales bacterium]|nr:SDR family NAD(P)-dependent oxidoreductase [Acidimicrobiales bacterium]